MLIRRALLTDIPAILALLSRIVPMMNAEDNFQWDASYPDREVFEADIRAGHLWVAALDSRIAGFAAITTDQEPEYAEAGWDISEPAIVTHRLAVGVGFRGRGVGKA
ncbi:MAG TPA: GNAT family N-acetyltransferase, partial [Sphingobacteriaceae bacterium]